MSKKRKASGRQPDKYCTETQYYRDIPLTLIVYTEAHFRTLKAKRFMLGDPKYNQNVWIPNSCLDETGRLLPGVNIDFVLRQAKRQRKFEYAHIDAAI